MDVTNAPLTELWCYNNQLSSLNLSTNTALVQLWSYNNLLSSLDVSANTALIYLSCNSNQLTAFDVSANTALTSLFCDTNQISTLDVSTNTALTFLRCNSNQLTALNVKNGNNTNMQNAYFDATDNPNLTCIEVDSVAYSTTTWLNKDATASYSTNCFLSIATLMDKEMDINSYPNPTNGNLTINFGKHYQTATVTIRNTMGQIVYSKKYNALNQIDLNLEGAIGVYFVSVCTEHGEGVLKVVKE